MQTRSILYWTFKQGYRSKILEFLTFTYERILKQEKYGFQTKEFNLIKNLSLKITGTSITPDKELHLQESWLFIRFFISFQFLVRKKMTTLYQYPGLSLISSGHVVSEASLFLPCFTHGLHQLPLHRPLSLMQCKQRSQTPHYYAYSTFSSSHNSFLSACQNRLLSAWQKYMKIKGVVKITVKNNLSVTKKSSCKQKVIKYRKQLLNRNGLMSNFPRLR